MRLVLGLLCLCWSLLAAAQTAGKAELVEGSVVVVDAAGKERSLRQGGDVAQGETVVTGATGEAHLTMLDGGEIAVRPNTRMRIEKYKAEGGTDDSSVFNLVQGAMRSVTGWIGKYNPRNYAIKTPTATIGVRGTDHETRVIPENAAEGEAGTYDKVNAGETEMRTPYGTTTVRPNQAGFFAANGRVRPKVLDRVPEFFRPRSNDKRFDGLHERVRSKVDTLRQDRAKAVQSERRQKLEQGRQQREAKPQQLREERRQQRESQRFSQRESQRELRRESQRESRRESRPLHERQRNDFGSVQPRREPRQERRFEGGERAQRQLHSQPGESRQRGGKQGQHGR